MTKDNAYLSRYHKLNPFSLDGRHTQQKTTKWMDKRAPIRINKYVRKYCTKNKLHMECETFPNVWERAYIILLKVKFWPHRTSGKWGRPKLTFTCSLQCRKPSDTLDSESCSLQAEQVPWPPLDQWENVASRASFPLQEICTLSLFTWSNLGPLRVMFHSSQGFQTPT